MTPKFIFPEQIEHLNLKNLNLHINNDQHLPRLKGTLHSVIFVQMKPISQVS